MSAAAVPKNSTSYRKYWAARFGTAPFLPMSRAEMEQLGWDSCDVIIVTGDAYVDHPSFGMAIMGRLLEAQGFRVGIIAQPDWQSAEPFKQLGRPNLFFGITAGNMDSMVNRYTSDKRIRSDDAYTPGGSAASVRIAASSSTRSARARRSRTCPSSSAASRPRCAASRTSTTGARRCAAPCCWMRRPTCWCSAMPSGRSCEIAHRLAAGAEDQRDQRSARHRVRAQVARLHRDRLRLISMRPGR